jgi:hypothetical protein
MDINYIIYLATKRIETTMIGALSRFEQSFGGQWGHFKGEDEELTEAEEKLEDLWSYTRNSILDHGNKQIRALASDIRKQNSPEIKFNYKLYTKENDK